MFQIRAKKFDFLHFSGRILISPEWGKNELLHFYLEYTVDRHSGKFTKRNTQYISQFAGVAELVDAHDSKSCLVRGERSILSSGTVHAQLTFFAEYAIMSGRKIENK